MATKQGLIAQLQSIFVSVPELTLVYLFGSQVDGSVGPLSDIDLGVLAETACDSDFFVVLAHRIASEVLKERVDLIDLRHVDIELAYAVIAGGICIYQVDEATRVEYEAQVMSRYGDYLPFLHALRADILDGDKDERRVQRYREVLRRTERTLGEIKSAE